MKESNLPEPQKSSAAQFLTYIASNGISNEKFEIRYENENIWMSQKMLAAVYGVEVPNVAYHLRKIYEDTELDEESTIKEILIVASTALKRYLKERLANAVDVSEKALIILQLTAPYRYWHTVQAPSKHVRPSAVPVEVDI